MNLTPSQRHALRTICRLGSVQPADVRHAMKEPVRCIIAKGLARLTEEGIEPTDDGWAMSARMRPPIVRPPMGEKCHTGPSHQPVESARSGHGDPHPTL